jgi:uncharacterized repeat protein (TIGR03803 family)
MKNLFTVLFTAVVSLGLAQNDTWVSKQDYAGPRLLGASFAIGSKVYAGTGMTDAFIPMGDFHEYDIATNTWTAKGDFDGGARLGSTSFSINGKGYIAFGEGGPGNDIWEYTPATDSWDRKADFPGTSRGGAFVFVVNNKAYIGAGQDIESTALNDLWVFDPSNDSWNQLESFPGTPRLYGAAFSIGTKGYVGTGLDENDNSLSDFWEYNTATGVWTRKADYPRTYSGTIGFATATRGYIGLGQSLELFSYYPNENVWLKQADHPASNMYLNASCAFTDGKAYVGLGFGAAHDAKFYAYTPASDQSITFGSVAAKTFGDAPFALTATASSGLAVSYTSSNTGVATISGSTVTIVGVGTTTITANQAGNATYAAAISTDQDLVVLKGQQTWAGALPATAGYNNEVTLTLQLSSGLEYTLTSSDPSVAAVALNGTNYVITPKAFGTTTLTASHPGNATFDAAPTITSNLVISKGTQTIVFDAIPPIKYLEGSFPIVATATSGLPVTFDALPVTAGIQINNNVVTAFSSFDGPVTARVGGNDLYLPATTTINIVVGKADGTLRMDPIPDKTVGEQFKPMVKTNFNYVPYTLMSTNPAVATIAGDLVNVVGKGNTNIYAVGGPGSSFTSSSVFQPLNVKEDHAITFAELPVKTLGNAPFDVTATSSMNIPVTFESSDPAVATLEGNTVTIKSVGQTMIVATAGNELYAIRKASQVLTVKNVAQTAMEQGQLFGVLASNASGRGGAIYKTNADGTAISIVKELSDREGSGNEPTGTPVLASNGKLYGLTSRGGSKNGGVLFEYDPVSGSMEVRYNFALADYPVKTFATAGDGKIYGTMKGGMDEEPGPVVFEFDISSGTISKKKSLTDMLNNVSDIFTTSNGKIFVTGSWGTAFEHRAFVEYEPASNTATKKAQITTPGGTIMSGPVEAPNGKIYGTTTSGGANNEGIVYEFDPVAGTAVIKLDMPKANFNTTTAQGFMKASNGKIYGMASYGGTQTGYIYEYEPDLNTMTVLANFSMYVGVPKGQLVEAPNGMLYGTDNTGNIGGTLFEFNPVTLQLRTLLMFNNNTGLAVNGNLTVKGDKLYGLTSRGGSDNVGTLFEFDYKTRVISAKINFKGSQEGYSPVMGLAAAGSGKMYGVTKYGGAHNRGIIFEFDPASDEYKSLFDFNRPGSPQAPLLAGLNGKLYGSTGPSYGDPALFEFDPQTGVFETVWYQSQAEGSGINHQMIQSKAGILYGMMPYGGASGKGVLFEFNPVTRGYRRLVDFGAGNGASPNTSPMIASNGKMYGTTPEGGANNLGVLFEFDPETGAYTVKHNFASGTGTRPMSIMIEVDGKLWGATVDGASPVASYGVVFQYDLATGVYTNKTTYESIGGSPGGRFLLGANGKLYGLTKTGGRYANGTISEYDIATDKLTLKSEMPYYPGDMDPLGWVVQTVKSVKKDQVITVGTIGDQVLGQAPFTPSITASSGLAVVLSAVSPNVTIGTDGNITLVQAGKATIKANQPGDASYHPASEAEASFCVNPAKPTITSGNLPSGSVSLSSSNSTGNQWSKDGVAIAAATSKTYEATTAGVYTVVSTVEGCESEGSDAFPIIVTDNSEAGASFGLYPNPVHDRLYINLPGGDRKNITLLQANGKLASEHETSAAFLEVDVRNYASGLYLVRIRDEKGSHPAMKFIKK